MTDDLLDRATEALREATRGSAHRSEIVLARLERSRKNRNRFRLPRLSPFGVALAAVFVGAVSWASASGKLEPMVRAVAAAVAARSIGAAAPAPHRSPLPRSGVTVPSFRGANDSATTSAASSEVSGGSIASPSTDAVVAEPAHDGLADAGRERTPTPKGSSRASAPRVDAPEKAAAPSSTLETKLDALYEVAHEAHFVRRDYGVALMAWDRYLAAAPPDAPLLLEARYDRAMALAHLRNRAAAVQALEPFANGDYGNYRRKEARGVIQSLAP